MELHPMSKNLRIYQQIFVKRTRVVKKLRIGWFDV